MAKTYYDYKRELDELNAERSALRTRLAAIARRANSVRVSMHRAKDRLPAIPTSPFPEEWDFVESDPNDLTAEP
jgi:hypothetical protein